MPLDCIDRALEHITLLVARSINVVTKNKQLKFIIIIKTSMFIYLKFHIILSEKRPDFVMHFGCPNH